jgi:hypothetical protein
MDKRFQGPTKFKLEYQYDEFSIIFPEVIVKGNLPSEAVKIVENKFNNFPWREFLALQTERLFDSKQESNEYEEYMWLQCPEDKRWDLSFK